jgi:UDP-glucose 4-epimerase
MPTSLVTGGAGFIGTHVVNDLIARGHAVVVLDDLSGGFRENVPVGSTFVHGSVTDASLVHAIFREHRFDYVYHLAAYAAEGLSHFIRRFNYTNNVVGSMTVLNESVIHRVKCFVFTSSIAVYGGLPPPMREDMVPRPEDPYGIAKFAVEQDLHAAHDMFGLNFIIFRPHNVYGEYQNIGDRYRNVIGIFMNQLMRGEPLSIFGDGTQKRAFSYIGDIAPTIAGAVHVDQAYNQTFNIGADHDYTVNELAENVMAAMGIRGELRHLPARLEVMHATSDHAKLRETFGTLPSTTLDAGLRRMASWVKIAGPRATSRFDAIEVFDKLPAAWLEEVGPRANH